MADTDYDDAGRSGPSSYDHESAELLRMFRGWDVEVDRHWSSWRKETRECYDIVAGRPWTDAEKAEMEERNRIAVSFNRTLPLVKAVAGAEIAGRLRVDYKPRTLGDSKSNEMLTSGAEWIRDECDAGGEESHAFFDCLVCGLGVTETRLDFEVEADGQVIEERVDPLEIAISRPNGKVGALDTEYIRRRRTFSKRKARERFGYVPAGEDDGEDRAGESVDDPRNAYRDDERPDRAGNDDVIVSEYQWYELRAEYLVLHPATGQSVSVDEAQFKVLKDAAKTAQRDFQHARRNKRVYRRAFVAGNRVLEVEDLPIHRFTYSFITGDWDRNMGVWFGLVRGMKDPQKWANRFLSLIIHLMATNAKGGVIVEKGAVEDIEDFEESWAAGDSVTEVAEGMLEKIKEKPQQKYPSGIDRMMVGSQDAIRDVAGISPEFLGQANRDQPGVLEHQRKQAAYGIMGTYFDSLRRFRKTQGTTLLHMMAFLPRGTLIRVAMDDWENPRFVPMEDLALDLNNQRYDVIVGDAPQGPNQKERTFALILQILPLVKDAMTPEIWLEVLRFSPLPESFVEKVKAAFSKAEESPEAVMRKQLAMQAGQLEVADKAEDLKGKAAKTRETDASTKQKQIETLVAMMAPDPRPQIFV